MKQFEVKINDPDGFHLRSASLVVKEAKKHDCSINIAKNDIIADAKNAFGILELKIVTGDRITFMIEGNEEADVAEKLQAKLADKL